MAVILPLLADAVSIVLFAALGERTHDGVASPSGTLAVAAPFLLALVLGWLVARAWRSPSSLGTGLVVWAVTVGGGMVLRREAFGRGTAGTFVVVAALFLALLLLGWRLGVSLLALLARRRAPGAPAPTTDRVGGRAP